MIITPTEDKISALQQYINDAKTIAIFGHEKIDGDAIGSVLGLGDILEKLGKSVSYFTTILPEASYNFVPGLGKIKTNFDYGTYDLLFFLDFTGYDRIQRFTEGQESYFDSTTKIVIDHHISDREYGDLEIKDTMSSSNCGWLYEICTTIRPSLIDATNATYFLLGLTTDTGNFMRGKSPERDFAIASELIKHGANRDMIIKNIYFSGKMALVDMAKIMFSRTMIYENVLGTWYTRAELEEYNLGDDEVESVQGILRSIDGNPVFMRLRYYEGNRYGSLRSGRAKDGKRISVQQIAISFEKGGGHTFAAGFVTPARTDLSLADDFLRLMHYINEEAKTQLDH